jgi:hypothetical protein
MGSVGGSPPSHGSTLFENEWTRVLSRLLRMYLPRNWEFGCFVKTSEFQGGGVKPLNPNPRYAISDEKRAAVKW